MRPTIIVMSHGYLAQELVNSAKMIIGEIQNIFTITMLDQDGLEGTDQKLSTVLHPLGNQAEIIILADLKGGTPCNVAMMKMNQYPHLNIISGVNLAMLIEASLSNIENSKTLANSLSEAGKMAIEDITLIQINSEDEAYEE